MVEMLLNKSLKSQTGQFHFLKISSFLYHIHNYHLIFQIAVLVLMSDSVQVYKFVT